MKAAVLHEFGKPSVYEEFPKPIPTESEVIVRMRAAGLSRASKGIASGSHYSSYRKLPVIVGLDGVGSLEDDTRVFSGGCRPPYGTMSELTVVSKGWYMPVPRGINDLIAAALPNAALSSWLPLEHRARIQRGETVLILGATGVSGTIAIQVAKHLRAGRVVAVGRNEGVLRTLSDIGADSTISLNMPDEKLTSAFAAEATEHPFNIILDYVWGHPAEVLVSSMIRNDMFGEPARTRYVSIGALAGPTASIPSAALRSSGLEIYGSGGGSASRQTIAETMPQLWRAVADGKIKADIEEVPLADVEETWNRPQTNGRIVFVP